MRIKTKYNIGDVVEYITKEFYYIDRKCKPCGGVGGIMRPFGGGKQEFRCVKCNGMGYEHYRYSKTVVKKKPIHTILINKYYLNDNANKTEISYGIAGTNNKIPEADIKRKVK